MTNILSRIQRHFLFFVRLSRFSDTPSSVENANLASSIAPIISCLRFFGLDVNSVTQNFKKYLSVTFGFLLLSVNVATHVYCIYLFWSQKRQTGHQIFAWNTFIDDSTQAVYSIGSHLVLYRLVSHQWPRFWKSLQFMDNWVEVPPSSYRIVRRFCIVGIAYAIVNVSYLTLLTLYVYSIEPEETTYQTCLSRSIYITTVMMKIYPNLSTVFFCVLAWTIRQRLKWVRLDIESWSAHHRVISPELILLQLVKWKKKHFVICKCARRLNRCFGPILILEIGIIYASVIVDSFYLTHHISENTPGYWAPVVISLLFFRLFHLTFITSIADAVSFEGTHLVRVLQLLELPSECQPIRSLICQRETSVPKFNACGLLIINRQLVPTLIGTVLTYLIVLFQFHKSEEP